MKACPAIALVLVSCGPAANEESTIECAIGGGAFERSCTVESRATEAGELLVVRNPRGGFRRLLLPRGGGEAVAADGAEPAVVTPIGDGRVEVAVGSDRYRFPAAGR